MNSVEINEILKEYCGEAFGGVFASDTFLSCKRVRRKIYIVNTDTSDGPGKHWVAIFITSRGRIEYFDPLGHRPPPVMAVFFRRGGRTYAYNSECVQSDISSSCGQFCIFYAILRSMNQPMNVIMKYFKDISFNEKLVVTFVSNL